MKKKILFLCTGNSCRSQMAEGFINNLYGDKFIAYSSDVEPSQINPNAIRVMEEVDIDISNQKVNYPEDFRDVDFDYVITLCDHARETCPVFLSGGSAQKMHWGSPDPAKFTGNTEEVLDGFRKVRGAIKNKIESFYILLTRNV